MMLHHSSYERYKTQMRLLGVGFSGQERISRARVLVVGAGGLGSVVLPCLAAAGVGKIGLADDDRVALDNLNRQVIYTMADIGMPKVSQAAERLKSINPEVELVEIGVRINLDNVGGILTGYDLVVDCTDNVQTRLVLNDACVQAGIPMVFGAVHGMEGQMAVLNAPLGSGFSANYRDFFPGSGSDPELGCDDTGVLGSITGIIGNLQAQEVLKLITGLGTPMINALLCFDGMTNQFYRFEADGDPERHAASVPVRLAMENQNLRTAVHFHELHPENLHVFFNRQDVTLLDIRDEKQKHTRVGFDHVSIPEGMLPERTSEITGNTVIVFCEKGIKSRSVAAYLTEHMGDQKHIYTLKYGISHWNKYYTGIGNTGT